MSAETKKIKISFTFISECGTRHRRARQEALYMFQLLYIKCI